MQQVRADISNIPFMLGGNPYAKDTETIKQDAGRSAVLAAKTVMAKDTIAAGTVTPGGVNTGDGTVTGLALAAGGPADIGSYVLECIGADGGASPVAGTSDPDGGNTGTGTVTSFTASAPAIEGDYILTCTDANTGGTATAGTLTADGGNTGNGVVSVAAVAGAGAKEGVYRVECTALVANSGRFQVTDPSDNGLIDLLVGTAYDTPDFTVTIADGSTDFAVGDFFLMTITIAHGGVFTLTDPNGEDLVENITLPGGAGGTVVPVVGGLTFTITDGGTDFAVDDFFTLVVAISHGGLFKLTDPDGIVIKSDIVLTGSAGGTVTPIIAGITFVITDGATDFAVGDDFTLTVIAGSGKWLPFDSDAVDGASYPSGIYIGIDDITAAAMVAGDVVDNPILVGGSGVILDQDQIVFDDTGSLTTIVAGGRKTVEEIFRDLGIFVKDTVAISGVEN